MSCRSARGVAAAGLCSLALAVGPAALAAQQSVGGADLALVRGKIATMDPARPYAEALAVVGDRILAVGSDDEIRRHIAASTVVIDLGGRLAIPGFIEGHGHFLSLGRAKMILDLTAARSWDQIVTMVAEAAGRAAPGEWIQGRGWHQEKWEAPPEPAVEGLPTHHALSAASPDNPVVLGHASGHASFVNARAMELAGITARTPDPAGGEIVRGPDGEPTGVLRETAQRLVARAQARSEADRAPEQVEAEMREMARLAAREALSKGVTTFHDAGSSFEAIDLFRRLADAGRLPVRLYVMVRGADNDALAERLPGYRLIGYGNHHLTVRSIKKQIDGALGSHGAWLLAPYADLSRSSGLVLEPVEEIRRTAEIAIRHGFQLNTHAIGDRANRAVLDIYERTFASRPEASDLRWRIEHVQHLHPDDVPRFARLGVIASMQGMHACSDGPWVIQRLGEERAASGAYVWRDLWDAGAVVTNGTDVPVEDIDPLASFHCSVTRELPDGSTFFPEQAMTREQALASYTINNAYAAFEEELKGSLVPGKLADIVVLSRDILTAPAGEILEAKVVYTIVGGRVLYRSEEQKDQGS